MTQEKEDRIEGAGYRYLGIGFLCLILALALIFAGPFVLATPIFVLVGIVLCHIGKRRLEVTNPYQWVTDRRRELGMDDLN